MKGQKRWYFMPGGTKKRLVTKNGIGEEKVGGTGSSSWLVENQHNSAENKHNLRLRVEKLHIADWLESLAFTQIRRRMLRRLRVSQSGTGVNKLGAGAVANVRQVVISGKYPCCRSGRPARQ